MLFRTFLATLLVATLAAVPAFHFLLERHEREVGEVLSAYLLTLQSLERNFVEHLPVYEDHVSPAQARLLRKHLLSDHLDFVRKQKLEPVTDDEDLRKKAAAGQFTSLSPYYFYNVPRKYRYLTPDAEEGLVRLAARFRKNLSRRHPFPTVKLAISSAVRPLDYQSNLRQKNANASLRSSHSYGVSFDIFYDDYYVSPPEPGISSSEIRKFAGELRVRHGFMMGDALRRQFHAILAETLIQAQEEGEIYAIHEKRQRCYHVTVLTPAQSH